MMTRLRRIDLWLGLISVLALSSVGAIESKALTLQQQVSMNKFQNQDETVGLADQGGRTQVIHFPSNGESVSLPSRPGQQRHFSHIKASLLSIGLFATLIRNLFFLEAPTRNNWAGFGLLLILYLVESATCSTRRYLSNICTPSEVKEYLNKLREVAPRARFHLECYHYEDDDSFRYHSSSQRRHDSNSSSKRVTHRASKQFEFQKWRDATKLKEAIDSLKYGSDDKATYLKITLTKLLLFMNSMCYQDYLAQHARFVFREGNRDRYTDSWTTIEVDGYIPKMLAVRTVLGSEAHVRMPVFWIFTLLGLTVPYRVWFSRNCDSLDLAITKEVS